MKISKDLEQWGFLIYTLFLLVVGICGFVICPSSESWLGIFSAKFAFLGFGIYGAFTTIKMIEYWDY